MLELLRTHPHWIEGIRFTNGLTDPAKTNLLVEYHPRRGERGGRLIARGDSEA